MTRSDVSAALRALLRHPVSSVTAVATVALAMGANLALLGTVWGLLHQERVTPESDRLLWASVVEAGEEGPTVLPPPDGAVALLRSGRAWDAVGAWDGSRSRIDWGGSPGEEWVRWTTPGLLSAMGIRAVAGRLLVEADTAVGAPPVALVTEARARARFGNAAAALGRLVRMDGVDHTVVGVIEEAWEAGEFGLHVPLAPGRGDRAGGTRTRVRVFVRAEDGSREGMRRAETELRGRLLAGLIDPDARPVAVRIGTEKEVLRTGDSDWGPVAALPLAVLLVASLNVATVLVARAGARAPALAVRRMLGARGRDLALPLLLEAAALAVVATGLALVAAEAAFRTLVTLPGPDAPRVGLPVVLGAVGLLFLVSAATAMWPVVVMTRIQAADLVRRATSTTSGRREGRARAILLGTEMALAVPLVLVAAGSADEALRQARSGTGLRADGLAEVVVNVGPDETPEEAGGGAERTRSSASVASDLASALAGHPDVASAGWWSVRAVPTEEALVSASGAVDGAGRTPPGAPRAVTWSVGTRETLGIPLLAGRDPSAEDFARGADVGQLNRTAARLLGVDPARPEGTIRVGGRSDTDFRSVEVVGIVGDVRDAPLFQDEAPPAVYLPGNGLRATGPVTVFARGRTSSEPVATLRRVAEASAGLPGSAVASTAERIRRETAGPRVLAGLTGTGGAFALAVAALGLFGMAALVLGRERRALGIRAALGAGPLALGRFLLLRLAPPLVFGAAVGLVLHRGAVELLGSPAPPGGTATFFAAAAFGLVVMSAAVAGPLRRATRLDPADVLRRS